ncbi:MAG: hypothetical protein LBP95_08760 [Deltaproteobacteria bacterium]|jgi:hypothetical protein|nr:hypothetical protein [Deltaproteobacteria bacterium]MDR1298154.1 hypothetical protein [Deltaproteobacteria bacterium]
MRIRTGRSGRGDNIKERLDCYGDYNRDDPVCVKRCSLSIVCALVRNEILDDHILNSDARSLPRHVSLSLPRK